MIFFCTGNFLQAFKAVMVHLSAASKNKAMKLLPLKTRRLKEQNLAGHKKTGFCVRARNLISNFQNLYN